MHNLSALQALHSTHQLYPPIVLVTQTTVKERRTLDHNKMRMWCCHRF